jgi:hypothetical protein
MSIPSDFNWKFYTNYYTDITHLNKEEAYQHYIDYGIKQNRLCKPQYYLSICAIFKNESHILDEWINHYINEGVDHFYLIDNNSTDDYMPIISKYSDRITLFHDCRKWAQTDCYNKYILPLTWNSEWIMVVDLDEFVYARNGFKTIPDYLKTLDSDVSAVFLQWKMFGSNGHEKQPHSVIKGFTRRMYDFNANRKSIIRSRTIINLSLHTSKISEGKCILSDGSVVENETIASYPIKNVENHCLHINHYAIQSKEFFFKIKATRGDADSSAGEYLRNEQYFKNYDSNDFEDEELKNKVYQ